MHRQRWITAIVALPLVIGLIYLGGMVFYLLIGAVAIISLWEYFGIVYSSPLPSRLWPLIICGFVGALLLPAAAYHFSFRALTGLLVLNFVVVSVIALVRYGATGATVVEDLSRQALGMVYIPLLLSCLVMIRNGFQGLAWIFMVLLLVFCGDTGAYYTGTYLGRHKLCPAISPGKTLEGALGGLLATVAAGLIFRVSVLPQLPLVAAVIFFICIGCVAPCGDLFESVLKRAGKIKDSGVILPGHGGMLDRIDALLFAAPVAYFFKEYIL
jgi:phosphatidate cytidylyltransferase